MRKQKKTAPSVPSPFARQTSPEHKCTSPWTTPEPPKTARSPQADGPNGGELIRSYRNTCSMKYSKCGGHIGWI